MPDHVLITGGAGFIGTRLARRFVAAGHTVTVLDAFIPQVHGDEPSTTASLLQSLGGMGGPASVIRGTVTSVADLQQAIAGATIVIHLAAETGTGQSMYEINRYVDVNVGGTAKLLDLLANEEHSVNRLVVASSRSIYGEGAYITESGRILYPPHRESVRMSAGDFDVSAPGEGRLTMVPTDESAKLHPSSVYGITKQMQESLCMTVAPTIGIEPIALRYQNVYGPGQSLKNPYTGILSIFSTLIRQGKPINIFEDGLESRDFVYIDDVVESTFLAATIPTAAGQTINVGSGVATTVLDVVAALFAAFGREVPTSVSGNFRIGDIRHNVADISKLNTVLGYHPQTDFATGVGRFVEWVLSEPMEESWYERSLLEMAERSLLK